MVDNDKFLGDFASLLTVVNFYIGMKNYEINLANQSHQLELDVKLDTIIALLTKEDAKNESE